MKPEASGWLAGEGIGLETPECGRVVVWCTDPLGSGGGLLLPYLAGAAMVGAGPVTAGAGAVDGGCIACRRTTRRAGAGQGRRRAVEDVPIYLSGIGTVQAYNTVNVKSRVDGEIIRSCSRKGRT